jgi:oligopeptide transport system substrate-binding protein
MPLLFARLIALLSLSLVGLFSGCNGRALTVASASQEGKKIFLFNNASDPRFLDPQLLNSVSEHHLLMALSEGLVSEKADHDSEVEPAVAVRWEPNADSSEWTFHLRPGVVWSDGRPITAEDFVWSYRRMLTKKLAAEYSQMLYVIKNGEAFYNGTVPAEALGVTAIDPQTLKLTLVGPTPHLLLMLCHTSFWPVPRHCIEAHGEPLDRMNVAWMKPENFVSNGPFILKENLFRQFIDTVRNPRYWDVANVKLDGVRFYAIEGTATEELLFRRELLHATQEVPLDKLPTFRKDHSDIVHITPNFACYFYRFNIKRPPFDDPRIRRAMALTIDRESLVTNVTRGGQLPAFGIVPPMQGYQGQKTFSFNVAEAQKLLAEAGFPNGKGFPTHLKIFINKLESHASIAQAIQSMWKQHLNIEIGIIQQEFSVYLDSQNRRDFDVMRAGWNGDYFDPATFIEMWMSDNGNNNTGWKSPAYDELVRSATQARSPEDRFRILEKAEAMVQAETPFIPIYHYTKTHLLHPSVKGWHPKLLDNHPWKHMDLVWPPPPSTMDKTWKR